MIIADFEADDLIPGVTKIHCAVFYDTIIGEFKEFTPENIKDIPTHMDKIQSLCMHNGIGYDVKLLKKILNYEYKGNYVDTLLLSRILWPDLEPASYRDADTGKTITTKSIHGVEGWGVRLGIAKPVHTEWKEFSPGMLHRCKEDVKIQAALYEKCVQEIKKYNTKEFSNVVRMEQKF